ncbi:MAG: spore coat protein CotJB [Lachnospiraceae bacterium]|nr:spore coat protein CotJB [Lachnospiraceae bacterium]
MGTNKEMNRMLNDIGIVDFILVDLMLYLDTHPHDQSALNYFTHYSKIKKKMVQEFSMKYYPLTKEHNDSDKEFRWNSQGTPLAWEGGC